MQPQTANTKSDGRITDVLVDYLHRLDDAQPIDWVAFLAEHQIRSEPLQEYLDVAAIIEDFAGPTEQSPAAALAAVEETPDLAEQTFATQVTPVAKLTDSALFAAVTVDGGPRIFGRYQILQQLGEGAMGEVYLAEDTQLGRKVALKLPKFNGSSREKSLQRFDREARTAAALQSRHICPVFDVGEIEGTHFICMAYVEGHPLRHYTKSKKRLSEKRIAVTIRKVATALALAHDHGIIHRDLKPANIMIDTAGEPVVMDFGLAKCLDLEAAMLTQMGDMLGTPGYMSPEQIEGESDRLGPTSDVYSLGMILYEMITGRLPFQGTLLEILEQVLTAEPEPPSAYRPDVTPALEAICLKMIAKQPEQRYQSMKDVARDLTAFLKSLSHGEPTLETRVLPPAGAAAFHIVSVTDTEPLPPLEDNIPPVSLPNEEPALRTASWNGERNWLGESSLYSVGMVAAVLLLVAAVLVQPATGTLYVEVRHPEISVAVTGTDIAFRGGTAHEFSLPAGKHALKIDCHGTRLLTRSFLVPHNQALVLTVELANRQLQVLCAGKVIATTPVGATASDYDEWRARRTMMR